MAAPRWPMTAGRRTVPATPMPFIVSLGIPWGQGGKEIFWKEADVVGGQEEV